MRPDRFQNLLLDHLPAVPGIVKAESFADAGVDHSPYGVVLHHHNGTRTWWQHVATSAPGDNYAKPEPAPVAGERLLNLPLPDLTGTKIDTSEIEAALVAALLQGDTAGETGAVDRYSLRDTRGSISHGFTAFFRDGSKIFVYGLASAAQGREPRKSEHFQLDATV